MQYVGPREDIPDMVMGLVNNCIEQDGKYPYPLWVDSNLFYRLWSYLERVSPRVLSSQHLDDVGIINALFCGAFVAPESRRKLCYTIQQQA